MPDQQQPLYRYQIGSGLKATAPTYVYRSADDYLYEQLKRGELCYVFNCRQMGKSSLRNQIMQRLLNEQYCCVSIDLSMIGSSGVSAKEWYKGFAKTIHFGSQLSLERVNFDEWWTVQESLPPVQILHLYFQEVLLKLLSNRQIIIFIDEIDAVLELPFDASDFFLLIRACFNLRGENTEYDRLTFALFGVAAPTSLVRNPVKTPFNIGQAIDLSLLELERSQKLAEGLQGCVPNPAAVLREIFCWTGGQPFLTQKLCDLIQKSDQFESLIAGQEAIWVEKIVRSNVIENWRYQDHPEHLGTIYKRLLKKTEQIGALLGLYQRILQMGSIDAEGSEEELELRLSGLVILVQGKIKCCNRIYQEVFDRSWIEQEFNQLCPYADRLQQWLQSDCQDESQLLRRQALSEALQQTKGKSLGHNEYRFLQACHELAVKQMTEELTEIKQAQKRAQSELELTTVQAQIARSEVAFLSKQPFKALLAGLEAGTQFLAQQQQIERVSTVLTPVALQIATTLHQAIYSVNERNSILQPSLSSNLAFSPDGQYLAAACKQEIKLWSRDGRELQILKGHADHVLSICFSPDGKLLASGSRKGTIKLWNLKGQELQTRQGHQDYIYCILFSPDGKFLASGSGDKTIKLWNLDGQEQKVLKGHSDAVVSLAFSPDGKFLASGSRDKTIKLWNQDGQELQTLKHLGWVSEVAFSPDSTVLVTGGATGFKLWRFHNQELHMFEELNDAINSLDFSPDGQFLATASRNNMIKLWSTHKGYKEQEPQIFAGHQGTISSVVFSPDGQTLASSSADNTIKLWSLNQQELPTLRGHQKPVVVLAFSSNGQTLVSGSRDGQIKLWDQYRQEQQSFAACQSTPLSLTFNSDERLLICSIEDKIIKLRSRDRQELQVFKGHQGVVSSLAFSADSKLLAAGSRDSTIEIWSRDGQDYQILRGHQGVVSSLAFSADSKLLAAGSRDSTIEIWSRDGQDYQILQGHQGAVLSLAFSPDGETLASGSEDKTIRLWNRAGQELKTLQGHQGAVSSLTFSPNGEILVAGGADGTIKYWNFNLNSLISLGYNWVQDYLQNSSLATESERTLHQIYLDRSRVS